MTGTPHYLRFARRLLALATTIALPACSDGDVLAASVEEGNPAGPVGTATPPEPSAGASQRARMDGVEAPLAPPVAATAPEEPDAGADAGYYGKSSGPLPPPEMPASRV